MCELPRAFAQRVVVVAGCARCTFVCVAAARVLVMCYVVVVALVGFVVDMFSAPSIPRRGQRHAERPKRPQSSWNCWQTLHRVLAPTPAGGTTDLRSLAKPTTAPRRARLLSCNCRPCAPECKTALRPRATAGSGRHQGAWLGKHEQRNELSLIHI